MEPPLASVAARHESPGDRWAEAIRRLAAWAEAQPALDDPTKCYGVTSGGAPEVVVAATPVSSCRVIRKVPM